MIAEAARETCNRYAERGDTERPDGGKRCRIAQHGARGPPECAAEIGRVRQHPVRLQRREARQTAGGEDRRDLKTDNEGRAYHRRHDLRDQPRALGADGAKQRDGQGERRRRRRSATSTTRALLRGPASSTTPRTEAAAIRLIRTANSLRADTGAVSIRSRS